MKRVNIIVKGIMVAVGLFLICLGNVHAITLLAANFDGDPTGSPPPGWIDCYDGWGVICAYTREEAAGYNVFIEVDDTVYLGTSGKSVRFHDQSYMTVGSHLATTFTPSSSVIVLEYYMMNKYKNNPNYAEGVFVNLWGDVGSDYSVAFNNQYIGILGFNGGWVKWDLMPYQENTWYYVKRTLDIENNSGTFYVEEVGNPANNASYSIGSNYANNYIDAIF